MPGPKSFLVAAILIACAHSAWAQEHLHAPGAVAQTNVYTYASARAGSDGFALPQTAQWSPGQDWYLTVHATPTLGMKPTTSATRS